MNFLPRTLALFCGSVLVAFLATDYEHATRIPLLVVAPGSKAGAVSGSFVETVDIFPTLCDLAGLPTPAGLDGRSFAATLQNPAVSIRDHITHVYPRNPRSRGPILGRAVRTERYRLVEWKKPGGSADTADLELYDYHEDPLETKNLAGEQPGIVEKLRALLAAQPEAEPQL